MRGARSALPVGCFTRCVFVFVFVFVSIYVQFEFIMRINNDDDDFDRFKFDDDKRKNSKKAKFVSNDRSGHDDQFRPKIVKIGAILVG